MSANMVEYNGRDDFWMGVGCVGFANELLIFVPELGPIQGSSIVIFSALVVASLFAVTSKLTNINLIHERTPFYVLY